jgi:hypothetical protein
LFNTEILSMQGNKLSAKADRAAIDEMQFKLASGGGAGGGGGGDGAMKVKIQFQVSALMVLCTYVYWL